jgi:hypothetical protein
VLSRAELPALVGIKSQRALKRLLSGREAAILLLTKLALLRVLLIRSSMRWIA